MRSHSINATAELTRERQRAPESGRTVECESEREREQLNSPHLAVNSAPCHSEIQLALIVSLWLSLSVALSACLLSLLSSLYFSLSLSDCGCGKCVCETKWLENHGAGAAGFRTRLDFVLRRVLVVCVCMPLRVCVWVCLIYAATVCVLLFGLPAVWI